MPQEFEVVAHSHLKYITAFLVRLKQRTPHLHREFELGYVLDGTMTVQTPQRVSNLKAGDLYLIDSLEPHEFIAEGAGSTLIALQLSPKILDGFLAPDRHLKYEGTENLRQELMNDSRTYRFLCNICVELAHCYILRDIDFEFRSFLLCSALVSHLFTRLPWRSVGKEDYDTMMQRASRLQSITDYIDQNFQRKLLLSEIAQREDLSLTYLSHFFKDNLGMSFHDYMNKKRLEYACELLFGTDRKILDISISSGFSDVRYFNEIFLERYGCTPKEYRKGSALRAVRLQGLQHSSQLFFTEQDALAILQPLHLQAYDELKQFTLAEIL